MARDDCGLCFGRGRIQCSACGGLGYRVETFSAERFSCSCSGGSVECPSCRGTGRRRGTSFNAGSPNEESADDGDSGVPNEPSSLAALRASHDKAIRDAHKARKDLLAHIERDQQDQRARMEWDWYRKFGVRVRELNLEAQGIEEELKKMRVELERSREDDFAFDVQLLESACARIETYRDLIDRKKP